ncbi:hypothetical protein C8R44DRAFT_991354 [Mycena epipterygia]|nr:hypothetical protein C8R44DRAFT_991354 [Mycena epipterygia]
MESVPSTAALPPELERQIFETYALLRPIEIPKLMLVAWRVKEWVEPLLYRTIAVHPTIPMLPAFTCESLSSAMKLKPSSFFGHAVRHFCFAHDHNDTYKYLVPIFMRLTNLWIDQDLTDITTLIVPLRLKHLYANISPLLRTLTPTHLFFSQITHLEVLEPRNNLEIWSGLSLIPQLTHLSLNDIAFVSLCRELLETCKSLAILVLFLFEDPEDIDPTYVPDLSKDLRFEYFFDPLEDWQMGEYVGTDYWSRAENFIARRRSGEIPADRFNYEIEDP